MCFGGGGGNQTVVQKSELPPFLEDFAKSTLDTAGSVTGRPYEPYGGQRLQPFSPDQMAGFDATRATQGAYQPFLSQAGTTAGQVAGRTETPFPQADISAYMNPFLSNVMDPALRELNRQGGIQRNQINAGMTTAGAYGGARHGVVEAEQRRNQETAQSDLIGRMLAGAYQDAGSQYRADQNAGLLSDQLRLDAAGDIAGFGQMASGLGYADAAALMDVGQRQQQQGQAGLDIAYGDFLRQFGYPIEMLNLRSAAQTSTPYQTQTTQTGPGPNNFAQNIGAFGTLLGGAGMLFG